MSSEPDGRVVIDPSESEGREIYFLLNSIVVPRPISWISTISRGGIPNLAPHSYTTVLSPKPPIVCFVSIGQKDTLRNVRETGDFVYNVGGEEMLESVNLSAADFPADESEFDWTGLTPVPSDLVRSPRVGEAPISMEARVAGIQQVAESNNFLVMGEVVRIHLAERIMSGERVDQDKLRPVARHSGSQFSLHGELVSLKRPTYTGLLEQGVQTKQQPVRTR